jgi:hypothetical protein
MLEETSELIQVNGTKKKKKVSFEVRGMQKITFVEVIKMKGQLKR